MFEFRQSAWWLVFFLQWERSGKLFSLQMYHIASRNLSCRSSVLRSIANTTNSGLASTSLSVSLNLRNQFAQVMHQYPSYTFFLITMRYELKSVWSNPWSYPFLKTLDFSYHTTIADHLEHVNHVYCNLSKAREKASPIVAIRPEKHDLENIFRVP